MRGPCNNTPHDSASIVRGMSALAAAGMPQSARHNFARVHVGGHPRREGAPFCPLHGALSPRRRLSLSRTRHGSGESATLVYGRAPRAPLAVRPPPLPSCACSGGFANEFALTLHAAPHPLPHTCIHEEMGRACGQHSQAITGAGCRRGAMPYASGAVGSGDGGTLF
jgi:hypothetical protein